MNKSLNQLKIKLQQKNMILVTGNVYDKFFQIKDGKENFENLDEKIVSMAEEMCLKNVIKFSPSKGKIYLSGENDSKHSSDDDQSLLDDSMESPLLQFINDMVSEILDIELERKIYVIDFSDTLLNKESAGKIIESIAKALSVFLDDKVKTQMNITNLTKLSKVIFVSRDGGSIIGDLTSKNIEFASVNISKPNKDERVELFDTLSRSFSVSNKEKLKKGNNEHIEAVNLTDGFACKEILQLGRIKIEDQSLTFKELFYLAQFNKKESEWEKINLDQLDKADKILGEVVKGQDFAIQSVKQTLINSSLGINGILHSEKLIKPKGILFFAGPTGTGKTELAKQIAKLTFGDESKLIRFDMSEYNHNESDQRLIGAPPGYVGYDAGGELTNAVKENPFSILLFDEIEKAHPRILDKFLQILEDGRLTSSRNELIDFSETFIIFTSNIGSAKSSPKDGEEEHKRNFIKAVEHHFINEIKRPELLNRIGKKNIIPFNYINDRKIFKEIIETKINKLTQSLNKKHNINIVYNDETIELLVDIVHLEKDVETMGGRGIINVLSDKVINSLGTFIFNLKLSGELTPNKIRNINMNVKNQDGSVWFK